LNLYGDIVGKFVGGVLSLRPKERSWDVHSWSSSFIVAALIRHQHNITIPAITRNTWITSITISIFRRPCPLYTPSTVRKAPSPRLLLKRQRFAVASSGVSFKASNCHSCLFRFGIVFQPEISESNSASWMLKSQPRQSPA